VYEASIGIWIARVVIIVVVVGGGLMYALRALGRRNVLGAVQPGLDALRAGFLQTRGPNEEEPVCVVGIHHTAFGAEQVTVGVTNHRILVVKGRGRMCAFPYDYEGEHLGVSEKTRQQRGFFNWRHGSSGYSPVVKNHPPFSGESWLLPPRVPAFPQQWQNLREFSNRFYFEWFYG
jgi:hypothetical protein